MTKAAKPNLRGKRYQELATSTRPVALADILQMAAEDEALDDDAFGLLSKIIEDMEDERD